MKTSNTEKLEVRVDIDEFTDSNFPESVEGMIDLMNGYKNKYPNCQLLIDSYIEEDYGNYHYCKFEIYTYRLETDEEYTNRIEKESTKLEKLYGFD